MIPHDMTSLNECLTGLMSCVLGHACAPERSWHHPEVFWVYSHLAVWSLWALCCVRACCTLSWSNPSLSVAPSHLIRHCLERLRNTEREFIYLRSFRHTKHVLSKLDVWANTICPVYCKHKQIYKFHTCCSFLHIVQLIVEEWHLLVFFLHYICNIVQKSDLAVCWFSI